MDYSFFIDFLYNIFYNTVTRKEVYFMDEQLKLIQSLSQQVSELIKQRDEDKEKYNNIENSIDEAFNNIQKMNKLLKEYKEQFEIAKSRKIFKFSIPCGVVAAIATFVLLIIFEDFSNAILNILMSGICSAISGIIVSCVPVMFLNIFENFFIKRFPNIKDKYHKIKNIENAIILSERNFNKMKQEKDNLYTSLKSNEKILQSKLMELYNATEYYFSHSDGKDICNQEILMTDTKEVSHGKKKIRTLEDNKNLNN